MTETEYLRVAHLVEVCQEIVADKEGANLLPQYRWNLRNALSFISRGEGIEENEK